MASQIVKSFAFLYAAVIGLICAVYVYLIRRRQLRKANEIQEEEGG